MKQVIEYNGPANIVTLINVWNMSPNKDMDGVEALLEKIEQEARKTIAYMRQIEGHSPKAWHEIKVEEE